MESNVINSESVMNLPLEGLQEALIALLNGDLKVKDGALVVPEVSGPRGPTAKVQPRLTACNAAFLEMTSEGVTAKALLEAGGGAFVYTDILLVARNLIEAGVITESRHGRKATWNLVKAE